MIIWHRSRLVASHCRRFRFQFSEFTSNAFVHMATVNLMCQVFIRSVRRLLGSLVFYHIVSMAWHIVGLCFHLFMNFSLFSHDSNLLSNKLIFNVNFMRDQNEMTKHDFRFFVETIAQDFICMSRTFCVCDDKTVVHRMTQNNKKWPKMKKKEIGKWFGKPFRFPPFSFTHIFAARTRRPIKCKQ